jgi:hypothetical protein
MFTSPVWRLLFNQRLMVERETPKSSWTSFLGMPRSIAASVFNLRSFEYAFMGSILIQVRYLRKPLLEPSLAELLITPSSRTSKNTHPLTWSNAPKMPITPVRFLIAAGNRLNKPKTDLYPASQEENVPVTTSEQHSSMRVIRRVTQVIDRTPIT